MAAEDIVNKVLEYLKEEKQINTFRLATELGIERHKLLNILKKLEEKEAVEIKSGTVKFLKFPGQEKKAVEKAIKKAPSEPKEKAKAKKATAKRKPGVLETTQEENKRLKEKLLELQKAPPKIIRRTKVKKIIEKVPVKSRKLEEQAERIKELEEKIKALQSAPPKIIKRTIIKKVPVKVKEEPVKEEKEEIKPKKLKLPKFNISWVKKLKFAGLNKNIKELNVPDIFKRIR